MAPTVSSAKDEETKRPATAKAKAKAKAGNVQVNGTTSKAKIAKSKKHARKVPQYHPRTRRVPPEEDPLPCINVPPKEVLTILAFGSGGMGELGLGMETPAAPRPCLNHHLDPSTSRNRVVQISCGGMHTLALTADNRILSWGVNDAGALGRDTTFDDGPEDETDSEDGEGLNPLDSIPLAIPRDSLPKGTTFVQVAAGDSCSFALTSTGLVYGWGTFRDPKGDERFSHDVNGNVTKKQLTPVLIPQLKNIMQIACGANHALALDTKGRVWAWGCNEQGQLGARKRYQLRGRALEQYHGQYETLTPREVRLGATPIRYIASGEYHSMAVDFRDDVWAWGLNSYGEAGYAKDAGLDAATLHPKRIRHLCGRGVVVLDGGAHHSVAVTANGECLVWGRMDGGQLGCKFTPEQLGDASVIRRDEYQKPRICLVPTAVPNIGVVRYAACGTEHTIFIDQDGHGYSAGSGSVGQLGHGDEADAAVARRLGGGELERQVLTWAGAGGQFSMVAASQ